MKKEMLPIGVRRDGSYYTRVLWCDKTENDPKFWVNNMINDDLERNGGTWGSNTETTANAVFDFFGETMEIKKISFYKNVGITISVLEELAKAINIYVCVDDSPLSLRGKEDDVESVKWTKVARFETIKEEGWQDIEFETPVEAKYVRIELDDNFCKRDNTFIPWMEMNEIKIFG